jgi:tetratricopeptide (TPR) repeat protein
MNLALAYYKAADIPEARKQFTQAHTLQPGNLNATLLLAECDLRLGDNKQAIDLLTPVQTTRPDDLAIAYLLGTALIRDKEIAKGQVLVDRILRNGDSAEARLLLGTSKLAVRDFTGALKDLEQAVKLNPDLPGSYTYFALARLQTGDAAGAAEAFREALKRDPNDYEANLNLGALAKQDREYDEAIRYLNKAASVRPGDLAALYQIAGVNFDQGRSEEARSQLETIVKSAPDFTEGHVMLATVYYRLKRKSDGDAQRAIVQKLNEARQAKEPGAQPQ